jgi:hypothetical protein
VNKKKHFFLFSLLNISLAQGKKIQHVIFTACITFYKKNTDSSCVIQRSNLTRFRNGSYGDGHKAPRQGAVTGTVLSYSATEAIPALHASCPPVSKAM